MANIGPALDPSASKGIHNMRVAIRRLRSVIRDLAEIVEGYPLKEVRNDLKKLADALGAVRDADVAVEALDRLAARAKKASIREGIELITERFRERRQKEFEKLRPRLSDDAIRTLQEHFEQALEGSLSQRTLFAARDLDSARREILENRVADFRKLSDALYDPFRVKRLHRLRIAGKHLRYAVELFMGPDEKGQAGFADSIAKMQTYLGDCHDCDVWIDLLRTRLKAKGRKTLKEPEREASVWLLSQFVRLRNKAYRAALGLWSEWERSEFLAALALINWDIAGKQTLSPGERTE
jgi:CHAD domain-containing protein